MTRPAKQTMSKGHRRYSRTQPAEVYHASTLNKPYETASRSFFNAVSRAACAGISAVLFLCFSLTSFPSDAEAGALSNDERYLKAAVRIAVVEVIHIEPDRANTYVNPPKLRFKILRSIRGEIREKEIAAIWSSPVPFDLDDKTELRKWYQEKGGRPYPPPEKGSRWIVILTGPSLSGDYYVDERCRYFYSRETFDWVASVIPEYSSQRRPAGQEADEDLF